MVSFMLCEFLKLWSSFKNLTKNKSKKIFNVVQAHITTIV